jgi:predicted nucleic acid-binding protein
LVPLAARAAAIALELEHPVYDCFYLALREAQRAPLVNADRRLIARTEGTTFAPRSLLVAEFSRRR